MFFGIKQLIKQVYLDSLAKLEIRLKHGVT